MILKIKEFFFSQLKSRILVKLIFILLAFVSLYRIFNLVSGDRWQQAKGDEYYWIAQSIAKGEGYSFPADHRWLFVDFKSEYPSNEYHPTAWEEPVYTYALGFAMKFFGIHGRLLILILQSIAVYFTGLFMYLIARKVFSSDLGVIASIILMLFWPEIRFLSEGTFSPAIFAGFGFNGSVLIFFWFLEKISIKRAIILGMALALSCLTLAALQLMVPIIIMLVLYFGYIQKLRVRREILVVVLTIIIVILPWTIRNYLVFGKVIPFRNGVGQGLHMSNQIVAATYLEGNFACEDSLGKLWSSQNATDAINQISNSQPSRKAIYTRSYDCILLEAPKNFSTMNEAERDKIYLEKSLDFIKSNPLVFADLTLARLKLMLFGWNKRHALVAVLSFISFLLYWKNFRVISLFVIAVSFFVPFSLIGVWFYRYRYPVDPILLILFVGVLTKIIVFVSGKVKKISFMGRY